MRLAIIYLVLFSHSFLFEGLTGLTVMISTIITLFVVMQMTGRIRWEEKFGPPFLPKVERPRKDWC